MVPADGVMVEIAHAGRAGDEVKAVRNVSVGQGIASEEGDGVGVRGSSEIRFVDRELLRITTGANGDTW